MYVVFKQCFNIIAMLLVILAFDPLLIILQSEIIIYIILEANIEGGLLWKGCHCFNKLTAEAGKEQIDYSLFIMWKNSTRLIERKQLVIKRLLHILFSLQSVQETRVFSFSSKANRSIRCLPNISQYQVYKA